MNYAVVILVFIASYFIWKFWKRSRLEAEKKKARDRIENVYLVSCHPRTGQTPIVGQMEEFIEFVNYSQVMQRKKEWEALLLESGNKFFKNDEIEKRIWIEVVVIFFRHGEFVNEDFEEEFGQRVDAEVRLNRAGRHKLLAEKGPWYFKEWHGQHCVEWKKSLSSK